jgi:hypothetical protein
MRLTRAGGIMDIVDPLENRELARRKNVYVGRGEYGIG